MKRLYRSRRNKVLAGVCGGIGEHMNLDPVLIRMAAVVLTLFGGVTILIYLIAILVIPLEPYESTAATQTATPESKPESAPQDPLMHEREKARMAEHVNILAILHILFGALGVVASAIIFAFFFGTGWFVIDSDAHDILRIVGVVISSVIVLISFPGLIAGIGLLKRQSWGRILTIILACINLVNIPFGTALGIYALWVLSKQETIELFQ